MFFAFFTSAVFVSVSPIKSISSFTVHVIIKVVSSFPPNAPVLVNLLPLFVQTVELVWLTYVNPLGIISSTSIFFSEVVLLFLILTVYLTVSPISAVALSIVLVIV